MSEFLYNISGIISAVIDQQINMAKYINSQLLTLDTVRELIDEKLQPYWTSGETSSAIDNAVTINAIQIDGINQQINNKIVNFKTNQALQLVKLNQYGKIPENLYQKTLSGNYLTIVNPNASGTFTINNNLLIDQNNNIKANNYYFNNGQNINILSAGTINNIEYKNNILVLTKANTTILSTVIDPVSNKYLPISGGTISGSLIINNNLSGNIANFNSLTIENKNILTYIDDSTKILSSAISTNIFNLSSTVSTKFNQTYNYIDNTISTTSSYFSAVLTGFNTVNTVSSNIESLNEKIITVNNSLNITSSYFSTVLTGFNNINTVSSNIQNLNTKIITVNNSLNVASSYLSSVLIGFNDINTVSSNFQNLNTKIITVNNSLTNSLNNISSYFSAVLTGFNTVNTVSSNIDNLNEKIITVNNNLSNSLNTISSYYYTVLTGFNNINTVSSNIDNLNEKIITVNNSLTNSLNNTSSYFSTVLTGFNNINTVSSNIDNLNEKIITVNNNLNIMLSYFSTVLTGFNTVNTVSSNIDNLNEKIITVNNSLTNNLNTTSSYLSSVLTGFNTVNTVSSNFQNLTNSIKDAFNNDNKVILSKENGIKASNFIVGNNKISGEGLSTTIATQAAVINAISTREISLSGINAIKVSQTLNKEISLLIDNNDKVLTQSNNGLITEITLSSLNIPISGKYAHQYCLVGKNGNILGDTIDILKDQYLSGVNYDSTTHHLNFYFYNASGNIISTSIDLNGLIDIYNCASGITSISTNNGITFIGKLDNNSLTKQYLTLTEDGFGINTNINNLSTTAYNKSNNELVTTSTFISSIIGDGFTKENTIKNNIDILTNALNGYLTKNAVSTQFDKLINNTQAISSVISTALNGVKDGIITSYVEDKLKAYQLSGNYLTVNNPIASGQFKLNDNFIIDSTGKISGNVINTSAMLTENISANTVNFEDNNELTNMLNKLSLNIENILNNIKI